MTTDTALSNHRYREPEPLLPLSTASIAALGDHHYRDQCSTILTYLFCFQYYPEYRLYVLDVVFKPHIPQQQPICLNHAAVSLMLYPGTTHRTRLSPQRGLPGQVFVVGPKLKASILKPLPPSLRLQKIAHLTRTMTLPSDCVSLNRPVLGDFYSSPS